MSGSEITSYLKGSFDPISNAETRILILGSMPGDRSLELGEYYGHAQNRFWKIIAHLTGNAVPQNYSEKKELLAKTGIGLWDVVHSAQRKGSLDTAIKGVVPNDLNAFIDQHKQLKIIAFNGKKSEAVFNKHFQRRSDITYISLPSSSPANATFTFERICTIWQQILV